MVHAFEKGRKVKHIIGYSFPINNYTGAQLCKDKAAASNIMKSNQIPHIRHRIFLNPQLWRLVASKRRVENIHAFAEKHHYDLVVKPKEGTGGADVSHVKNGRDLELAINTLFNKSIDVVLCAFKKIHIEYRVLILNDEAQLIFQKEPPFVSGDGSKSLGELITQYLSQLDARRSQTIIKNMDPSLFTSKVIPPSNEKVYLHWKHNLGQGASCDIIGGKVYYGEISEHTEETSPLKLKLVDLAQRTTRALDVNFASVDIVEVVDETNPDKKLRVMEVNSGVMMDNLISQKGELGKNIALKIYTKAIEAMFEE